MKQNPKAKIISQVCSEELGWFAHNDDIVKACAARGVSVGRSYVTFVKKNHLPPIMTPKGRAEAISIIISARIAIERGAPMWAIDSALSRLEMMIK